MSPIFRRADRRTEKQADKRTDKQTEKSTEKQAEKQAEKSTEKQKQGKKQAEKQLARESQKPQAHPHLVTLIRKPGCHLCDDAHVVIEKVCGELGVPWEEKDITQDEELYRKYWEQIPVVLVDGEQHTFWRVNEQRLRKALTWGLTE